MNNENNQVQETIKKEHSLNTKQQGEALELLTSLEDKSVNLVFLDPQYEKIGDVSRVKDWPLHYQSEYQIISILKEITRTLKPSGFCLLWVNKEILKTDRVNTWLLQAPKLKLVDLLVWSKDHFGFGAYFRSKGEYAYLLQKMPTNSKKFTNRSFPNIWTEGSVSDKQRKHPHQKPFFLIRSLIEATTNEEDLIVDPCAGSFIVLDACLATNRNFLGCDLTFNELQEREREREQNLLLMTK
jgi:site-specific DNA-methyltransferase (adenine-specific)